MSRRWVGFAMGSAMLFGFSAEALAVGSFSRAPWSGIGPLIFAVGVSLFLAIVRGKA